MLELPVVVAQHDPLGRTAVEIVAVPLRTRAAKTGCRCIGFHRGGLDVVGPGGQVLGVHARGRHDRGQPEVVVVGRSSTPSSPPKIARLAPGEQCGSAPLARSIIRQPELPGRARQQVGHPVVVADSMCS